MTEDLLFRGWVLEVRATGRPAATVLAYGNAGRYFARWLSEHTGKTLADVDRDDLRRYITSLREQQLSTSTINTRIIALKLLYRFAVDEGDLTASPAVGLRLPKVTNREM
jgi:integrase/recombinase XerD